MDTWTTIVTAARVWSFTLPSSSPVRLEKGWKKTVSSGSKEVWAEIWGGRDRQGDSIEDCGQNEVFRGSVLSEKVEDEVQKPEVPGIKVAGYLIQDTPHGGHMVGLPLGYSCGQHVQHLGHVVPKQKVPGEGRRREDICPGTSKVPVT